MRHRITATLLSGRTLTVEYADHATAAAELRRIERLREYDHGDPDIFWETTGGERWCLSYLDFAVWPEIEEPQPAAVE